MSKLQNCDKRLTVGGYGIPAVAISRYNYYWQWLRLLAMAMATAIGYGGCVKTQSMRAALGFAACQSKKGNSLIIRLLPLQGVGLVWRIFTQGVALGYVLLPLRGVLLVNFDTPSSYC